MEIKTKYSLGDKAWKINRQMPRVWRPCTFCEGRDTEASVFAPETEITGSDGSTRRCPKCQGRGGNYERVALKWLVTGEMTVGLVEYRLSATETREAYMCAETGVGGGTIHYVSHLYPTKKEAQEECDRRNSESQ